MVAHKKGKKKSKKQHGSGSEKEVKDSKIHAEIIDEESEYPTSRVIKRAPNGDVIVESLPEQDSGDGSDSHNDRTGPGGALGDTVEDVEDTKWPIKLDTHWESLSLEERRNILRISKDELFEMIKSYKNVHSCDCSMCGRNNNMNIEQEIEQIYAELYESAKYEDAETDFIQFHLKLIKEYQSKGNDSSYFHSHHRKHSNHKEGDSVDTANSGDHIDNSSNNEEQSTVKLPKNSNTDSAQDDSNDPFLKSLHADYPIKYYLPEEVLAAEEADELKYMDKDDANTNSHPTFSPPSKHSPASLDWKQEIKQFKSSKQKQLTETDIQPSGDLQRLQEVEQISASPSYGEVDSKLLSFAKTLVSSHPHIAEEFINRAIMYPHIKAITEDMMNNEGEGLKNAMESLVLQQQQHQQENEDALSQYEATSSDGGDLENSSQDNNNSDENEDDDSKQKNDGKTIDTVSATGSTEIEALINNVNFDFVKDPTSVSSLIGACYDVINNKDKRLEIDKDNREHKEELERLRHEISAAESHESYDWSNDEYEEGSERNEPDEDYIDDEDIDDHHLDSDYDDDDVIYDDIDENVKSNKESYSTDHGHGSLIDRHHKSSMPNDSEECIDDDYDSEIDHAERLEEGRRLIQIAITKLLQKKLIASYQEKEAEKNRERLLMELEAEENQKKEREKRKQKKKEKEKEKKRLQQLAKEEEKRRQEEEELRLKKEAEEKELARREAQRKKVEEAKRKSDEKRKKKLAEQRRREEEQERIRKEKEELKRQREEEQKQKKLEKEKKQRELEEQRQQKKRLEEIEKQKQQQQQQQQQTEATIKSQEHASMDISRAEATPYNLITNDVFHSNTTLNDDIFNMINQASKSMSSSPSRTQDSALDASMLASRGIHNPMSTEDVLLPPSSTYSLPNTSPHTQTAFSQQGSSLPLNSLGSWEQSQSSQAYYNAQNPSVEVPNTLPSYADGNVNVSNEVNSITNFLKDTTINDIPISSKNSLPSQSLEPLSISPRPQSVVYNRPALWSNGTTQRINRFNHQQAQPNQLSSSQQRRSIWDSSSDSAFAVNSTNGFGSSIWGSATPIQAPATTILPSPQATEPSNESYMDILTNCYKLLSPDNSFVPLDKLYQASLTQINAKSVLSYSQFVSTLMSMKKLNKCELLNDNTGMLAYCRMGGPMSAGLSAYSQGSYSGAPSHATADTQSLGAIPTTAAPTNPLAQSLNSIFGDVSFSQAIPAVPAPVSQIDGMSNTNPDPANYLNYDQSFPVSYQGSNIWS